MLTRVLPSDNTAHRLSCPPNTRPTSHTRTLRHLQIAAVCSCWTVSQDVVPAGCYWIFNRFQSWIQGSTVSFLIQGQQPLVSLNSSSRDQDHPMRAQWGISWCGVMSLE